STPVTSTPICSPRRRISTMLLPPAATLESGAWPVKLALRVGTLILRSEQRRRKSVNLFQQHAVKDFAAAAEKIPVIDYGPFFAGEPGALERLVPQVRHACENIGFLYIVNHGVPQ